MAKRLSCGVILLVLFFVQLLAQSSVENQKERMFTFQLPWDDSDPSFSDISHLNPKPAGRNGPVRVGPDGHLYTGTQRIRFLGTNFTFRSAMPEKDVAVQIARRLAKFGINIVRFHLIDANWGTGGIIDSSKPGTRQLHPAAVDRLDFFVSELKKNGIYSNLNLLAGRDFTSADGLSTDIDGMDWKEKKTPAFFDQAMIDLQKEYATQLLVSFNPGSVKASIEVPVFRPDGSPSGDIKTLVLEAGARVSKGITEFVKGAVGQVGGYISICSDQPLITQELFGTMNLSLLSAVPPTVLN